MFITSSYPASVEDPRGTFIHELARALVERGVHVMVLAPGAPGAPYHETRDGVTVFRAKYWRDGGQALATGVAGIMSNLRERPWLVAQAISMIASMALHAVRLAGDVDVVHAHWVYPSGLAAFAAARLRRKRFIVTSHGSDLNLARSSVGLWMLCGAIARRADACIGVSHSMAEQFGALGVGPPRIRMIPIGAAESDGEDTSELPAVLREAVADFSKHDGLRVVFAGRLIPLKSVDTLIAAQALLLAKGIRIALLIIGDGPCGPGLRASAQAAGGLVKFVGAQPPARMRAYMRLGDVLVLPSLSEGRGLVLVEAMLEGLAVVASDIDGARELVEVCYNGLVFEAGNASALAERLEALAQRPELLHRLKINGREFVSRHGLGLTASAGAQVALYRELMAQGS